MFSVGHTYQARYCKEPTFPVVCIAHTSSGLPVFQYTEKDDELVFRTKIDGGSFGPFSLTVLPPTRNVASSVFVNINETLDGCLTIGGAYTTKYHADRHAMSDRVVCLEVPVNFTR